MYSAPLIIAKYIRYFLTASNGRGHGIHSPFVFEFIKKVLNDKANYPEYKKVENLRARLLKDSRLFIIEDFGAGGELLRTYQKRVDSIARKAAKSKKYGQLLFRMIKFYQPSVILELGTSLGITTSYLSLAKRDAKVITLEGAGEIAGIATKNFKELELVNTEIIEGTFDDTLSPAISHLSAVDFAFIDGNHRQAPTERYFQQILGKTHNDTVLVFDDIHWSREMESAWKTIKGHDAVGCTIDLFFVGIVFFKKEFKEKQHFVIRF